MERVGAFDRFHLAELSCRCGQCSGIPGDLGPLRTTALWLEDVERALGSHYRLTVVSAYRCEDGNAEVAEPGPVADLHTRGLAADVTCYALSPGQLQRHLAPLAELVPGILSHRGLTHIHRHPGAPVRWRP